MLYGTNKGTNIVNITEDGKVLTGQDGLYASAVYDKPSKNYIVKIGNNADKDQQITLFFKGGKLNGGKATILHGNRLAENTIKHKNTVIPYTSDIQASGNRVTITIPAKSFGVYRF